MEAGGNSKGWIRGGTGGTRGCYGHVLLTHPGQLSHLVWGGLACTDPGAGLRSLGLFSPLNAASPGHALVPWLLPACIPRPGLPVSVLPCPVLRLVLEFDSCAS